MLNLVLLVLAPLVLLVTLAAGAGYVRLLQGPISLKDFRSQIENSINADLHGFSARIDDAHIALADDFRVEVRLTNLRIEDDDGDLVASAPLAALELNRTAFWRLQAAPKRVYLIEPRVTLTYSDAHGLSFSIAQAPPAESDADAAATAGGEIVPPRPVPAVRPDAPAGVAAPSFHHVNFARLLAESSAKARRGNAPTSRLKAFGLRNARVTIIRDDRMTDLIVTEASVDVDHEKRDSVISGRATIDSPKGPWQFTFRTEDSERSDIVHVAATVETLVPSAIAPIAQDLDLLNLFDTPVSGELDLDLSNSGQLITADLSLAVGAGFIRLPALWSTPFMLDSGQLGLRYDADTRRLDLRASTFDWGGSRITLTGALQSDPAQAGEPQWHFAVRSVEGAFSAEEFGVAPIPVDNLEAMGRIIPSEGLLQLSGLSLDVGGGSVNINGEIIGGSESPSTRVEASVSPMPLAALKAMWPRAAAPAARDWVGAQVERANLRSASLKVLSGRFLDAETETSGDEAAAPGANERISARIEIADLRMTPLPNSLPIAAAQAIIRLENSALEVSVPDAQILIDETRHMPLKDVRLTAVDVTHDAPVAELALASETSLAKLIETLNRSQLNLAGQGPLPVEGVDGKVDGELKIAMPLIADAKVSKIEGRARISDLTGKSEAHKLNVQGGTVDIEVSDIGVIAKGDMSVNGVLTQLNMHRILDAPPHLQPPIRISATLDNADRLQLGLDVNNLVQGEISADVTITQSEDNESAIRVQADLTNAELIIEELAWRKQPGRQASLEFDMNAVGPDRTELNNFKVVGDMIALDGRIVTNAKRELLEYAFPNFSLNVVSRLDVRGKVDSKKIWKVTAKGTTFDAKDLFRSLLALGKTIDQSVAPVEPVVGVDLTAEIDTVLGHSDVSLRNYKVKLSQRHGQLVSLDGRGTLDGGEPFAVLMSENGPRRLYAESTDAGQTFKLVGFYPNMQGGRMRLEVDLDARGAAEKSGVLWVDNFRVLGDPVISQVYSSAEGGTAAAGRKRQGQPQREVFEFQRMRAPFSVGHGQFVLGDSQIRGPLVGASIRGRVDYNTQRLNLGGTYVPLQGINSAFCDIPLFGPIVAGLDCQGVFGITYAIQGRMGQPQVLVNPLSMLTPGIFRGIMEMTSPNPQVQPLSEQQWTPAGDRVRASSSGPSNTVDGWSSETTLPGEPTKGSTKRK